MGKIATNLKYDNITISSLPGAGSTTLAKGLEKKLNWEYFAGGDFMRQYAIKKGLFDPKNGFHHDATVYDDDFDRQVDFGMRKSLKNEKHRILDSWLSGFMAQNIPGVLKILVYCSDDAVKVDRVANRDGLSIKKAKNHIFERQEKNINKWRRLYANEWKKWVVDKGKVSAEKPIYFWYPELYDLEIDTFSHGQKETLDIVLEKLGYTNK